MEFKYTRYLKNGDCYDFYYEPKLEDLKHETINLILDDYYPNYYKDLQHWQCENVRQLIEKFTDDNDNWQALFDWYKEALEDVFKEEAMESECNND